MSKDGVMEVLRSIVQMDDRDQQYVLGYMAGTANAKASAKEAEKNAQAEDDSRAEKAG